MRLGSSKNRYHVIFGTSLKIQIAGTWSSDQLHHRRNCRSHFKGQQGFLLLYGTAVAAMFFVWTTILVTHIRFRQTLPPERLRILPIKMPGHPLTSMASIVAILALAASTAFVKGMEWTIPTFIVWLAVTTVIYFIRAKEHGEQ